MEKPNWSQRLKAIWRILLGKPKTKWTRVEWQTGPIRGKSGYSMSVWLGMSDMATLEEGEKTVEASAYSPTIESDKK